MRRLLWIVPAVLLVASTVIITGEVVKAQIIFPDQTVQDTAFTGPREIPTGAAYSRTRFFSAGSSSAAVTTDVVPPGQELVVLKVIGWNTILSTLDSRLPSPNQNNSPVSLAMLIRSDATSNVQFEMDFPDGAVVVDEGRQPYLAFRSGTDFSLTTTGGAQVITVIGYIRNKP